MSKEQPPEPSREPRRSDNVIRFTSMATQMGITIFLGVWGGMKLDKIFPHRVPIFTLILSLTGVVVAIYMVIKDVLKKK